MAINPTMSKDEREAFLAGTHVGIFAVSEAQRGPCAVPVWYQYTPGDLVYITMPPSSLKLRLLKVAGRASLCAQQESLPTKYVSVEGPVEIATVDAAPYQREIAERYLGAKLAARYFAANAAALHEEVLVALRPERWWSVDHSRMKL